MNSSYKIYDEIKNHIESFGYRIISGKKDYWDSTTKTICCNTKRKIERRIIYLLHELGHIYLFQKSNYDKKFAPLIEGRKNNRFTVSEIEQEVLAWDEAEKLASRFGISIDENFYKFKFENLKTYIL